MAKTTERDPADDDTSAETAAPPNTTRREFTLSALGGVAGLLLAGCSDGGAGSASGSGAADGVDDEARRRRDMAQPPDLAGSGDLANTPPSTDMAGADLSGGGTLQCVVRPQETEGPYFVDERLLRSDVRSDPSNGSISMGAALQVTFSVSRLSGTSCTPLGDAMVDIWSADALGVYSDVVDSSGQFNTVGKKFLRGYQNTDAGGVASFTTLYPGWYTGRTVHVHFKIRATVAGKAYTFTSQLYFDDTLTDKVHATAPYSQKGQRNTRNAQDGIYKTGGAQLLLNVVAAPAGGYTAGFTIGLQI